MRVGGVSEDLSADIAVRHRIQSSLAGLYGSLVIVYPARVRQQAAERCWANFKRP